MPHLTSRLTLIYFFHSGHNLLLLKKNIRRPKTITFPWSGKNHVQMVKLFSFHFSMPICEFNANKGEILIIIHIFSSNQLQIRMLKIAGRHIAIFANLSSKMLIPTPWITLILITEMKEKMRTLLIMRNSVPIAFPRKMVRRRNEVSQSLINLNASFNWY